MRKGSKMSKKSRKKMSLARLGKTPWSKGKKFSKEYKRKLSIAHKGQVSWNKGKKCPQLSGENNPAWKGGITFNKGYAYLRRPNHPFNHNGYVKRARLVMEKHLGRYLTSEERVHHINEIKDDDRIKNLKFLPNEQAHRKLHNPRLKSH